MSPDGANSPTVSSSSISGKAEAATPALSSKWHSIRPWNAQLSLHTKEITSVSATFILSTEPTSKASDGVDGPIIVSSSNLESSLDNPVVVKNNEENDDPDDEEEEEEANPVASKKPPVSLLAQILQRELQIKVNSVNWPRVLIRIDENGHEAVIIVYGLMPGREYDIDLAIVPPPTLPGTPQLDMYNAEGSAVSLGRRQVLTFEADNSDPDSTTEMYTDLGDSVSNSSSSDPPQALSTPSTSPSRTIPNTPPATPPPASHPSLSASTSSSNLSHLPTPLPTLEDRLNQLRQKLHTVNAERETLASSLKSARRESNKMDALLKAEIEALKRSSEKFNANESRQRQKILALQEAVKRAQAATRQTQQHVRDVESEVPAILKEKEKKEKEYEMVKQEAEKVGKERKERVEEETRRREGMKNELAGLTNKLEKLNAKKERQETVVIPNLEDKLQQVQNEIEEEERMLEMLERMERERREVVRDYEMALQQQTRGPSSANGSPTQLFPPSRIGYATEGYHLQSRSRGHSFNSPSQPQLQSATIGPISRPSLPGPIRRPTFPPIPSRRDLADDPDFEVLLRPNAYNIWASPTSATRNTTATVSPSPSMAFNTHDEDDSAAFRLKKDSPLSFQHMSDVFAVEGPNDPFGRRQSGSSASPSKGVMNTGMYSFNTSAGPNPPVTPPGLGSTSVGTPSAANASTSTSSLGSTLSSRAPVFQPRRGFGLGLKIFTGSSKTASSSKGQSHQPSTPAESKTLPAETASGGGRSTSGSSKHLLSPTFNMISNPGVIGAGRSGKS